MFLELQLLTVVEASASQASVQAKVSISKQYLGLSSKVLEVFPWATDMFTVCSLLPPQNSISRIRSHVVEVEIKGDLSGLKLGRIVFSCHSTFTKQKQKDTKFEARLGWD